ERRSEPAAKEGGSGVDLVQIDLGEGCGDEAVALEPGGDALRGNILVEIDAKMLGLAFGRRSGLGPGRLHSSHGTFPLCVPGFGAAAVRRLGCMLDLRSASPGSSLATSLPRQ